MFCQEAAPARFYLLARPHSMRSSPQHDRDHLPTHITLDTSRPSALYHEPKVPGIEGDEWTKALAPTVVPRNSKLETAVLLVKVVGIPSWQHRSQLRRLSQ